MPCRAPLHFALQRREIYAQQHADAESILCSNSQEVRLCWVPCLQAMIYSGMNGIGLALVVPCVQSLIADYTPADKRGAAFGVLYFTGALG